MAADNPTEEQVVYQISSGDKGKRYLLKDFLFSGDLDDVDVGQDGPLADTMPDGMNKAKSGSRTERVRSHSNLDEEPESKARDIDNNNNNNDDDKTPKNMLDTV